MALRLQQASIALIAGLAACATSPSRPSTPESELGWLLGCWMTETGTVEEWTVWDADRLMGEGRSPRSDGTTFNEFLTITRTDMGYEYLAEPEGATATNFSETVRGAASITFENAAHDFPQRISYERSDDQLIATVSMTDGSRAVSWTYTPCEIENISHF